MFSMWNCNKLELNLGTTLIVCNYSVANYKQRSPEAKAKAKDEPATVKASLSERAVMSACFTLFPIYFDSVLETEITFLKQ